MRTVTGSPGSRVSGTRRASGSCASLRARVDTERCEDAQRTYANQVQVSGKTPDGSILSGHAYWTGTAVRLAGTIWG